MRITFAIVGAAGIAAVTESFDLPLKSVSFVKVTW
jgi:hypothetical protein